MERVVQQGLGGRQAALGVMVLQMEGMVQIQVVEMVEMVETTERQEEAAAALERMLGLEEPKLMLVARGEMVDLAAAAVAAAVVGVVQTIGFPLAVVVVVAMRGVAEVVLD